jgi:hypothetical protein
MNYFIRVGSYLLFIILCVGANSNLRAADNPSGSREVEIDVFSGRPNPVFSLQTAEIQELDRFLSKATVEKSGAAAKAEIIPSILGYRGLRIRERGDNKVVVSEIQVAGKDILIRGQGESRRMKAPDNALEQYLVDLALSKKAIDAELHKEILRMMQKR